MAFVLDASIVHAWVFDERQPEAEAVRRRLSTEAAIAPSLWWFEVRNGLIMGERRGRITERGSARALRDLSRLNITLHHSPDEPAILALARRHRLTVYDAAYLELAMREGLALATLDGELLRAARAEHVSLVGE
ncbi:MAG: type II toxin-antitoxin system VapC family toxin [Alphaproteobacteria bacterium]|nr:type II toxin-antitoxin system VapC family toxin [Alphaproteobacteria bacterium]MBV9016639.1 type II toxin-antitoxin system VapC family toxin [Alphaproteobacteria bacterium]MBV9154437.1 type II toxin-antitoxin system VapC family toxin [Alphaproteobacteria bacterium]MBV9583782.1 type II toxin-antitoxin system VapC family toxin [Alphaproteobacteria bacterium]